jgi:hypothetical protein
MTERSDGDDSWDAGRGQVVDLMHHTERKGRAEVTMVTADKADKADDADKTDRADRKGS